MKIEIFMDIDGVLRDLSTVCKRYFPKDSIREYDNSVFGKFWETMAADKERAKELYLTAPLVPGADKGLNYLRKKMSPSIHFITACGIKKWPWLRQYTEEWIVSSGCFKEGDEINFLDHGDKKAQIINEFQNYNRKTVKAILFDDRVDTINALYPTVTGVWVESGLVLDRVRLRSAPNIHRISKLSDLCGKTLK